MVVVEEINSKSRSSDCDGNEASKSLSKFWDANSKTIFDGSI